MSLYICSLNSGSNGNCYYVGNDNEAVLVDAGISCRETEKRMSRQGLTMEKVRAIFVSHEHTDHITGVPGISKKYKLPVYITRTTLRESRMHVEPSLVHAFSAQQPVTIGSLTVRAFKKSHDASDPHSFLVSGNGVNVGVFTDIGFSCQQVIANFRQCHAAFLEANYCEEMLAKGSYPYYLKQRIRSDNGHLSNKQALELFTGFQPAQLTHLVLSHLSKNNNSPQLVEQLFLDKAGPTRIIVASRYEETAVYCIEDNGKRSEKVYKIQSVPQQVQLSLF